MTVADQASPRLAALLPSASVEISSRGHQVAQLRDHFAEGTDVTITFLPGDHYRHNVETATVLRRAGFVQVGAERGWAEGLGREVGETVHRLD